MLKLVIDNEVASNDCPYDYIDRIDWLRTYEVRKSLISRLGINRVRKLEAADRSQWKVIISKFRASKRTKEIAVLYSKLTDIKKRFNEQPELKIAYNSAHELDGVELLRYRVKNYHKIQARRAAERMENNDRAI